MLEAHREKGRREKVEDKRKIRNKRIGDKEEWRKQVEEWKTKS